MVRFGYALREKRVPEWSQGYVDYEQLKSTLEALASSGMIREFNEDIFYSTVSIASSHELLMPAGPREADFIEKIDHEIEKVNLYTLKLHRELDVQTANVRTRHDRWVRAGRPSDSVEELSKAVAEVIDFLQRFEDYVNMNYMAFSKILKKHDKLSSCPCRMVYLMKIRTQTFYRERMAPTIKAISDMHASLSSGLAVVAGAGAFDPNQKGGTSFMRKTAKYWVAVPDVLQVKMFILRNRPIYKFSSGDDDADLVSSVYLDNERLELYQGRLRKIHGALAIRIRWYGPEAALGPDSQVFVERKTHRESWYGDDVASAKERFPLSNARVVPFLQGRLTPEEVGAYLRECNFKGDIEEAVQLAREIQAVVLRMCLRPSLRTHYMRTAFQHTGDATVRCSLDTELCMSLEVCKDDEWKRSVPLTTTSQVTQFPHAVLEVKLQLAEDKEQPSWVTELLQSGALLEMPKFSKFVHGTAYLRSPPEVPYWWDIQYMQLWAGARHGYAPLDPAGSLGHFTPHQNDWLRNIFMYIVTCGSCALKRPASSRT